MATELGLDTSDRTTLERLNREYVAAFMSADVDWYQAHLADEFVCIDSDGSVLNKTQFLWKILLELVRSLVVTLVMAHLIAPAGIAGWLDAVRLGIWVAIGFPVMILMDSVTWDKRPWQLAAIHAGDWVSKILLMALILGAWR